MAYIKLRDRQKGTAEVEYNIRNDLRAFRCDACGKVYRMKEWCNDPHAPGAMNGNFDMSPSSLNLGNTFSADVCSLGCADELFKGGWKLISEYVPFADCGAALVRVSVGLTALFKDQNELIDEWESKENDAPKFVSKSGD